MVRILLLIALGSGWCGWAGETPTRSPCQVLVTDYGAVPGRDCSQAIAAAYSAIPKSGGALVFPSGTYYANQNLSFTDDKPLDLIGSGCAATILYMTNPHGDGLTIANKSSISITNMTIRGQDPGVEHFIVVISDCSDVKIANDQCFGGRVGLFKVVNTPFLEMTNVRGDASDGNIGGDCLCLQGTSGDISNCRFRTGNSAKAGPTKSKPCVWIIGPSTSLQVSNCSLGGGGPHSCFDIAAIASSAKDFTLTTTAPHDFKIGDYLVVRNCPVAAYNSTWRIARVTDTTISVDTTLNPGASAGAGTAESMSACVLVSNEHGYYNESRFDNILFEGVAGAYFPGSASLYFDGRRHKGGQEMASWNITGCYFDFGTTGLLLSSAYSDSPSHATIKSFTVSGCSWNASTRGIFVDQAVGVTITGCQGGAGGQEPVPDHLALGSTEGVLVNAGPSAPFAQGITITGCQLGMSRGWQTDQPVYWRYDYGVFFIDPKNLNEICVVGNQLFGNVLPVSSAGPAFAGTAYVTIKDNICMTGTWPPVAAAQAIPRVAAASSLQLTGWNDTVQVTGSASIKSVEPGSIGRTATLLCEQDLTLVPGGNLAIQADYAVRAGHAVALTWNGTAWFIK